MTTGWLRICALVCLTGCARAPAAATRPEVTRASARYTVATLDDYRGARVRACFEGGPIHELVPMRADEATLLRSARLGSEPISFEAGRIPVHDVSGESCIEYVTRLERSTTAPRSASAVVVSQAQWLWRPEPFPSELDATVRFLVPPGDRVFAPWPRIDDVYAIDESAFFTDAYVVFGVFDAQSLAVAGTVLEVARLGPRPSDAAVKRWLGRSMQAAASIGPFPRDRVHFIITPAYVPEDDVVFGMLRRGGGASILLVPSVNATRAGLDTDWVAVHELSHLWLPKLRPRDRWLSEGIATYLQEVLRARCGLQDEATAWQRLVDGFDRGRRSGTGRRLLEESRDMDRTGAYKRVYWAGAAFALEADLRLRDASGGEKTLIGALGRAQKVWGDSARPVTRAAFLRALDGSGALTELGRAYEARSGFPDTRFVHASSMRGLRAEIMRRADDACGLSDESSR